MLVNNYIKMFLWDCQKGTAKLLVSKKNYFLELTKKMKIKAMGFV